MKSFLITLIAAAAFVYPTIAAEPAPTKLRVLFIGNSLTATNDLPAMIEGMAKASGRELASVRNLVGGATLEKHWNDGKALGKIKEGHLDYVVLQDLSKQAYADKDSMFRHGRLFDAEIQKIGARTILYMTWPLDDSLNTYGAIADAYTALAKELHATLAPVGVAWHTVAHEGEKPAFQLYRPDHKHPMPAGTYLAACVFYRVLYGAPSSGLPNHIELNGKVVVDLPRDEAAALQKIADATPLDTLN
jgi:hypothetical protein